MSEESFIIQCSSCDKKLCEIVKHLDGATGIKTKIKAKCCFCGDYSYTKEFVGKFYYNGLENTTVVDTDIIPTKFSGKTPTEFELLLTTKRC